MTASQIRIDVINSLSLKDNPLGDPSRRELPIYLPPGYNRGEKRYPVVYLLAGFTNRGSNFLHRKGWQENLQERMDRLIAQGVCRPMIVVLPDAFTRYGGSQYLNSPAVGRYQDYLLEIVEHIDANYRTLADREHRAATGFSSGGYGAWRLALDHPETFGLIADHSGDKYFEFCYRPEFPRFLEALERFQSLEAVLADPGAVRPIDTAFHTVMNIAAMSACYSPNPASPLGFDLPVDLESGEVREEVWARWLEHDPVHLVEPRAEALRSLRLIYMDCGQRDQFHLHLGSRILSRRLKALDIPHRYEEFDDDHFNIQYRLDHSLPAISRAMP